jgi:uncharacterized protein
MNSSPGCRLAPSSHPGATSLPMLDGYVAAIVTGPVPARLDLSATRYRRGRIQPRHAAVRRDFRRRAAPQRHQQHSLDHATSVHADPSPQAEWRRRRAAVVPGIPCRHAPENIGLGSAARHQHQPRLAPAILLYCVDDQGRPLLGPQAARPRNSCATPASTFQTSSRPCASTGCRPFTHPRADHCKRGS